MNKVKKGLSYIFLGLLILTSVSSLLTIWEIIYIPNIITKTLYSFFIIFIAMVISIFIFSLSENTSKN